MKCLILAGGHGTRLRPLTLSVSKPFIPFCNKPIIEHQISEVIKAGVDHIIISASTQQNDYMTYVEALKERYNVRIDVSVESYSLGTAGPIRFAKDIICEPSDSSEDFFVLNSDVICIYPFKEMISFHRSNEASMTILVTKVDQPSDFGVVVHDDNYKIKAFVEKPTTYVSNQINAGVYMLSKSVIDMIPEGNSSIERYLFPKIVSMGKGYCHPLSGYWADIGKPLDYLHGQQLFLSSDASGEADLYYSVQSDDMAPMGNLKQEIVETDTGILFKNILVDHLPVAKGTDSPVRQFENFAENVTIKAPVLIHKSARIGAGCCIGPNVVIGANADIGKGCRITRSCIMQDSKLDAYTFIEGTIVGWDSHIKSWQMRPTRNIILALVLYATTCKGLRNCNIRLCILGIQKNGNIYKNRLQKVLLDYSVVMYVGANVVPQESTPKLHLGCLWLRK
ncbi:bifunctional Mannose-1-phosphate guanyltransferase [Babesia duncani]|uniref:mannose-1-phosphate guanylyltransferase n=1 Tax=Babesia duncani TaxID=323732 RepID=A0AAD9UMW0_9APIC|nr:bifunctional Mannose-1-phosphate guanyltransferase [Babesia duncani]